MTDRTQISDVDLIRLLGEYSGKASAAYQSHSLRRGLLAASIIAVYSISLGISAAVADVGAIKYLILVPVVVFGAVLLQFYIARLRISVELAVWQLRRVYELVSRREDLGLELDSGTRLELELRLGEAAFLLSKLERFDHPEKFHHFQRVGRDSPFAGNGPTEPSPFDETAESVPPTSRDYSASTP